MVDDFTDISLTHSFKNYTLETIRKNTNNLCKWHLSICQSGCDVIEQDSRYQVALWPTFVLWLTHVMSEISCHLCSTHWFVMVPFSYHIRLVLYKLSEPSLKIRLQLKLNCHLTDPLIIGIINRDGLEEIRNYEITRNNANQTFSA